MRDRLQGCFSRGSLIFVGHVRHPVLTRSAVAAVLLVWVFSSQHCLLGGMQTSAGSSAAHPCCHQKEATKNPPAPVRECCHLSSVTVPLVSSAPAVHLHELWLAWEEAPLGRLPEGFVPAVCGRSPGPPGAGSFVELVLNRSLLAHAPPVFVVA